MLRLIDDICTSQKGIFVAVDRSTLIQNAQRFMARGQIDKAIEEWQKLVSQTPQDGNLYNTIGDLYLKKNSTHQAVETFLQAATAFERAGFTLKTIAVYKKILKVEPSNLIVNLKLADLNADRGLTGNAIEDYLKVAKEYVRTGKVREALDIYRKIATFDPGNINIGLKLAELSLRERLTTEAIDEYMKVAKIYEQNGRTSNAAGIYKKILEIDPKHEAASDALKDPSTPAAPALPTISEIEEAIAIEDWDAAGQKADTLLIHEPTNLAIRRLRGKVLLHKGEKEAAWADYRAVADESLRIRRTEEAIQLVREYLEFAPDQREAVELQASLFEQGDQIPDAVRVLATLIDLMDRDGVHESELKKCFLRMKALDPENEITARYKARFEPPPAPEEPVPAVAEDVLTDIGMDEIANAGAGRPQTVGDAAPVESEPMPIDEEDLPAPMEASVFDEQEQPEVSDPVSVEQAVSPVDASKSDELISHEPLVGRGNEVGEEHPSVSVSRPAEVSQSQSRDRSAPSVRGRGDVAKEQSSVSKSRRADTSLSRSRDRSAPSLPKSTKKIRPRELPDYFAEAEVYLKYGLAAQAIEQYQLILSIDANNTEAHSKLRELYRLEGRLEEAVTHSVILVQLYLSRGERDDAEQIWREAQEWCPDDPRLQADLLDQAAPGSPEPAPRDTIQASQDETIERPKQDLQEWLAEAEFYLQQGLQEQARELFETIRRHYPDAPEVASYFAGQPSSANVGAHSAVGKGLDEIANEPDISSGGAGSSLEDSSLSKQLEELFPGAFRGMRDPQQPGSERLVAPVEGENQAVEQGGNPQSSDSPDPHYSLGLAYKEMGLYAEARKEFEQAMSLPTYRIDSVLMIAACHQAEGQPRLAIRQLQQCLDGLTPEDPKWADVACESARLYAEIDQIDKAVSVLQLVIKADATHEQAATLLQSLQQSATPNGSKEKGKVNPPKSKKTTAEDQVDPAAEPAGSVEEKKPDKNKRRRISYV
jgi:tetratricopeptide (TPR) repeat protein